MKRIALFLSLLCVFALRAQDKYMQPISSTIKGPRSLENIDCELKYGQYLKNDSIHVNGYHVYTRDSLHYFSSDTAIYYDLRNAAFDEPIDTRKMHRLKHGSWSEQFEVNKNNWLRSTKVYTRVGTYVAGYLYGKMYTFDDEMNVRSAFQRYPIINDTIFYGSQITRYDEDENVIAVEFIRFNEADDDQTFNYQLFYDEKGKLELYLYHNEKQLINEKVEYDSDGHKKCVLQRHGDRTIRKKWSTNRKRLKVVQKNKDEKKTLIYRNGELIRSK